MRVSHPPGCGNRTPGWEGYALRAFARQRRWPSVCSFLRRSGAAPKRKHDERWTSMLSLATSSALARRLRPAVLAFASLSCAAHSPPGPSAPVVRWLKPSETAPHGSAPGAQTRLLTTQPDGTKTYALVLSQGDQVQ